MNAVAPRATASRFSPSTSRKPATMRSAAPLSVIAVPMIAASAITMPMLPAVRPNASATREIFTACSPGARKLTTIAAPMRARNALRRRPTIPPMITTMPTSRMTNGCMPESATPYWHRTVQLVAHRQDARMHVLVPHPRRRDHHRARSYDNLTQIYARQSFSDIQMHLVQSRRYPDAQ